MGWFLCKNGSITLPKQIFVPAWGWVGSLCLLLKCANLRGIRPRLGMGWFDSIRYLTSNAYCIFVPEWGWVGSKLSEKYNKLLTIFVPVWGWVGSINIKDTIIEHRNFRPRVGMGWFRKQPSFYNHRIRIFVPEWGWVGSADFNRNFKKSSNTI